MTFDGSIPECVFSDLSPPTSTRAEKAIARVQPQLEADLAVTGLQYGSPIFIRIFKESRELELWVRSECRYELFRIYEICHYSGRLGPKQKQGDHQAPEGFYHVTPPRLNPVSQFHLSIDIGYPNRYDRVKGRTGRDIMVHGNCVSIGCFAMGENNIEEIYALADAAFRNGQRFFRVHVFPFRMTQAKLAELRDSPWYPFWSNLREGYVFFERKKLPPNVKVRSGRYVFEDAANERDRSSPRCREAEFLKKLAVAAHERTRHSVRYDGSYRDIPYPNGHVPADIGVCTDLVIRAYRAVGIDLQQVVHKDMARKFSEYPNIWGLESPDPNIDHRRVPNLQTFFQRHGAELADMLFEFPITGHYRYTGCENGPRR